jgi:hypothetical protein
MVCIEQQYTSTDGSNFHAIEIAACLAIIFLERFPFSTVCSISASARAGWQKERAMAIGHLLTADKSETWYKYIVDLEMAEHGRSQHICDAITMIVDKMQFSCMSSLAVKISQWEGEHPPKAAKKKSAGGSSSRGRVRGRGRGRGGQ